MGFTTGAKPLADIIDEIANNLIAAGNWSNVSANWNTSVRTADNARRALKFESGAEKIYLALEAINVGKSMGWNWFSKGIRVTFSSAWDALTDSYGGSTQMSFINFESAGGKWPTADMAALNVTYWLWVEQNGFVIMGKPEPRDYDNFQMSFIIVVERNPVKEYVDGYTNFFFFAFTNIDRLHNSGVPLARLKTVMRPFAFTYPADNQDVTAQDPHGRGGILFAPFWWPVGEQPYWIYAFKSIGNGKVYYMQPLICNTMWYNVPALRSNLFFRWTPEQGLIDGDVLAVEGTVIKYLCKAVDSPDGGPIYYGMKFLG